MNQTSKRSDDSSRRLRGLDSLRGLAALGVVLYHYTTSYESHFGSYAQPPLFRFPNGHLGVQLFFCLSGFVILSTIERTQRLKHFAIARFARIYPTYFVCAVVALGIRQVADLHLPALNAPALAANALMLSSLSGTQTLDPSYWTLSYEVIFYASAAVVWSLSGGRRRLEQVCLAWLAASLAGHLLPWLALHHKLAVLLNLEFANLFVLGMMLYCLSQGERTRLTLPTLSAALLLALFPSASDRGHISQLAYVATIVCFCALIWIVADTGGRFLDIKPLVFLGEISYSLYLIHQVAGFAVIRFLLRLGLTTNAAILLTICLMVGIALGLRTFVEKPAERWIKGLAKPNPTDMRRPEWAVAHSPIGG
jgi:peptidoglycan/LPS O-acetylase OafA/YrhL